MGLTYLDVAMVTAAVVVVSETGDVIRLAVGSKAPLHGIDLCILVIVSDHFSWHDTENTYSVILLDLSAGIRQQ